ncbi:MAG: UDP-N-acetylmuramoyl-L-alanine--D-glutamate ligase [Coriobacteriia bacterium]|nr:UDP-N-acetylmuramoyl-L-alanine--D-glutamate ligase [Coriobacteriia bacterium]
MTETKQMPIEDLIEGTKQAPKDLGSVLVLGLGKSGKAVATYCADLLGTRVRSLSIAAGKYSESAEPFAQQMRKAGARVEFDHEQIEGTYDLCVVSPGISEFSDFYQSAKAASREIVSEVEFAWRESAADSTWVAVTGTNGKTTTTSLVAHLLKGAGMNAAAVGNIGDCCIDAVASGAVQTYVAEVSSYQLASTVDFAPQVALILNVTPDHLAWHRSFEAYKDAKLKVLSNLASVPGSYAVLDATDDEVRAVVRQLKSQDPAERGFGYVPVGTAAGLGESMIDRCGSANAAFLDNGVLRVDVDGRVHELCDFGRMAIKGTHNASNALCAAAAALCLGVGEDQVVSGLLSFQPLEHRIEPCGSVNGVACFNDSKATNVDATLKALSAFEPGKLVLLLGGCDKGTDLTPLVQEASKVVRAVVCFGDAGPRFADAFEEGQDLVPVIRAGKLAQALDAALEVAVPGDAVALSPACASFDEFNSFEHRGDEFKSYVAERAAARGC